ncbi:MAG: hypothetical protein J0M05_05940 [Candidatus Kapabacteria bacterium]|nr:hypothetical protein [Candidatus Kapabacteria bacterium]
MKRVFHIGLLLLIMFEAKTYHNERLLPDTVDFWEIILNGRELLPTRTHNEKTHVFGNATYILDSISDKDLLYILYFTDTPCSDCPSKIELRNKNGNVIKTMEKAFDNSPFQLTGVEIKNLLSDSDEVYIYFTGKHKHWRPWRLLGIVKMGG